MIFQFQTGHSLFHRIDPFSKLLWLVCISVLALTFRTTVAHGALLLAVLLCGLLLAGLSLRTIWRGLRLPVWFGVPYFILQLLFLPGQTELFTWGKLTITIEALDYAGAISLRLITLVLASLLFIYTTDPRDVVLSAAQQLRVPYRIAFAISIALRFLPILQTEAHNINAAQRLRGQERAARLKDRIAWRRRFMLSVFTSAVRHVRQTADAMDAKGFGRSAQRTYRRTLRVPPAGYVLSIGTGLVTVVLFVLQVYYPFS